MNLPDYGYYKSVFAGQPMPFAFVDLDLLNQNILGILSRSGDKRIRIATKSLRCRYIIDHILRSDPRFKGLMCYTLAEALWLSGLGFDDILLGYPSMDETRLVSLARQLKAGKTITLMVDLPGHLEHLDRIGKLQDVIFRVCLDMDMSVSFPGVWFGVKRSSVRTADDLKIFLQKISGYPNVKLVGLMGYEAQVAGVTDTNHGSWLMNAIIRFLKKRSVTSVREKRKKAVNTLGEKGLDIEFVNGGGTGSLESTSAEDRITEVTAGSGFFAPQLFDQYAAFRHLPASGFAIQIVRQPEKGIFTCMGGGYIASGATGNDKVPKPHLPKGASLLKHEMAGEVQTPVLYEGPVNLGLGDPVFFRHSKAGELCEHFNFLHLVSEGKIVETVPTYRGEGHAFL